MSDDAINGKWEENSKKDKEQGIRKKILQEKELDLKEKRVDAAHETLNRNREETEKSETVKFGQMSEQAVQKLLDDNNDYLEAAKNPIPFINSEFDSTVPFFRKNLIMITAPSGKGKSTAVANIVDRAIRSKNPLTGKPWRMLVLSNEEAPEDFYNRLTCFLKGWQYSNHDKFTDDQRKEFSKYIKAFTQNGLVTVIGDTYEGVSGWTSSAEGLITIFNKLIRDKDTYDVVILDYFQNIVKSREKPEATEYEAQRIFANEIDRIKNVYPGAIVVMAQSDPPKDENDMTPINFRLKGSRHIITKCTFICEIVPEHKLFRSTWTVHKSRFTDSIGKRIITGFDKGKFVPYTEEFQRRISKLVEENLVRDKEDELGLATKSQGDKDES